MNEAGFATPPWPSFSLAGALDGNGFIAAFVAGIAFGAAVPQELDVEEAVEELGDVSSMGEAIAVVALTVLMSVVLHGVSAGPFGSRYVRAEATEPEPAGPDVREGPAGRPPTPRGTRPGLLLLRGEARSAGGFLPWRPVLCVDARTEEWPGEQLVGLPSRRVGLP